MKDNKVVINILLIIIMILVVVACVVLYMCFTNDVEIVAPQQDEALFTVENYPRIDGSVSTLPLAEAFKSNFTKTDISEVEIEHSKSNNAFINLINGNTDLILVKELSKDEQKLAQDKGIGLEIVPVAKDAFVFFVNENNPVQNLTLNQIQNIYSGKIKNWKDVGGTDSKIKAYQKPEGSTSQNGMIEHVMKNTKMIEPITKTITQDIADIVDVILDYDNSENSLGYSYRYYTKTMFTNDTIKMLSVNGFEPTYENIQTGLYELQTKYYAIIRKDEPQDSDTRKLLNAMISENGQNVAKEAGYVQNY